MPIKNLQVPVTFIREGKNVIAYCPLLDLSTYGRDMREARKRFASAVKLFLDELEDMGTLHDVLTELGWKLEKKNNPVWIPPKVVSQKDMDIKIPVCA